MYSVRDATCQASDVFAKVSCAVLSCSYLYPHSKRLLSSNDCLGAAPHISSIPLSTAPSLQV
eukprot:scaffold978_cov392-Prasinococcus_capsulatus_cf.AAC.8